MDKNREFAKILRKLRNEKGISQENLSLEANLARTYISLLERELRSPSLKTINKICEVLEILPSNFMELVQKEKNQSLNDELNNNATIEPQLLYSHLIDIIGNTLNIIVIDKQLTIAYANQNICDTLSYNKNDLLNLRLEELAGPASITNIKDSFKNLFNNNSYAYSDIICKSKNGENIYFNTAIIPHNPETETALLVLIDYTECKKNKDELLESQSYLGMALAATKQVAWRTDFKNNTISILSKSHKDIGYFPKEETFPLDKIVQERIHPQDHVNLKTRTQEASIDSKESYYEFEYRSKRDSNEYKWNLGRCQIIKWDQNEKPEIIVGTSFDIDEKKRAQESLALNELRLESLLKLNQIMDSPLDEIIKFAIEEMVNLTESESGVILIKDKMGHDKIYTNAPELKECSSNKILDMILPTSYKENILIKQDTLILNNIDKSYSESSSIRSHKILCTPVKDNHEVVIICMVNNKLNNYNPSDARQLTLLMQGVWRIIEHKKINEQKKEMEKNLSISSRLASMNVLCRCIAHEVNNPLSLIQGLSDELRDNIEEKTSLDSSSISSIPDQLDQMVDRISLVMKGMKTFVQDSTMGFVRDISVEELITNSLNFIKTKLKNIDIDIQVVNNLPKNQVIDCHPSQIAESLLNLLYNSMDAIYKSEERWIKLEINPTGTSIEFAITDSGKGINPEISSYLFSPFFTTKEDYRGQGLGLHISKSFIKEHGGTIVLDEGAPNTCFRITLPVKQD